jgi:signal transduction histidine kinase
MNLTNMMNPDETAASRRELAHDLRSPLSVIAMSLEVLPSVRNDEEQFLLLCKMMTNAVGELKVKISAIVDAIPSK